jgi:glucose-6-phosphate 1-epimerase
MLTKKTTDEDFPYLLVENGSATAKIALQGAHLFHYEQKGKDPLLWLSENSHFTYAKAIRGGIPICWPWFGKHPTSAKLPQHGFARTALFTLTKVREVNEGCTELTLELRHDAATLELWPHRFRLQVHIRVASALSLQLSTSNRDSSHFEISSALHSYFAVSHIDQVSVQGLEQKSFLDLLTKSTVTQQGPLHITGETDRIYQNVTKTLLLKDTKRTIHIAATGSRSCVVWNPWIEKSKHISDMGDTAYQTMLCVETANAAEDSRILKPGSSHDLQVTIT